MGLVVSADPRIKIKESEKIDKYLNFAWKLKKLWNRKVTVIPIVVGALGMLSKDLEKRQGKWRLENELKKIQIMTLLK